jgi:hypothetical protein
MTQLHVWEIHSSLGKKGQLQLSTRSSVDKYYENARLRPLPEANLVLMIAQTMPILLNLLPKGSSSKPGPSHTVHDQSSSANRGRSSAKTGLITNRHCPQADACHMVQDFRSSEQNNKISLLSQCFCKGRSFVGNQLLRHHSAQRFSVYSNKTSRQQAWPTLALRHCEEHTLASPTPRGLMVQSRLTQLKTHKTVTPQHQTHMQHALAAITKCTTTLTTSTWGRVRQGSEAQRLPAGEEASAQRICSTTARGELQLKLHRLLLRMSSQNS